MTIPNGATLSQLGTMMQWGSPLIAGAAAQQLIARQQAVVTGGTVPDWRIAVYDKMWNQAGVIGDYIEQTGMDPRNKAGTATIKVKGDDPNIPALFNCMNTLVGITIETEGERFAFYVDTFEYEYQKGAWVGTAHCISIYDILSYLQVWPDWFLPIQAQILSYAILLGPIVSCLELMIMEQALRIQTGLNEFINNALSLDPDVRSWFGSLLTYHGNIYEMLTCPVVVCLTNPLVDTSVLMCRTIRFESCAKVIEDVTRATGVDVNVDLWLPGDPQPANCWTTLVLPTYVVTVHDRMTISGPTGTILDSVVKTIVDLTGSVFGNIVAPIVQGSQEVSGLPQGYYVSPLLGVNWLPPWVLLIAPEEGQPGTVDTCKVVAHTPKGWQQIIGGRSPQWLNSLINIFFSWIIDAISILLGFTGIPQDLLSGFLNNAFLAFQLWESYERRNAVGPYHPGIEVFHATASAPYNMETILAFINAFWDGRGYLCVQASCRNGVNYTLGKDIFRGQLITIALFNRTLLYTDWLESVSWRVDEKTRDLFLQIGDGKAIEAPSEKHLRNISGLLEAVNVLTLAPQSG